MSKTSFKFFFGKIISFILNKKYGSLFIYESYFVLQIYVGNILVSHIGLPDSNCYKSGYRQEKTEHINKWHNGNPNCITILEKQKKTTLKN